MLGKRRVRTGSLLWETKVPRPNIPPPQPRRQAGSKAQGCSGRGSWEAPPLAAAPGLRPPRGVGPGSRSPPVARRQPRRLPGSSGRWLPMLCAASRGSSSSAMSVYPQRSLGDRAVPGRRGRVCATPPPRFRATAPPGGSSKADSDTAEGSREDQQEFIGSTLSQQTSLHNIPLCPEVWDRCESASTVPGTVGIQLI